MNSQYLWPENVRHAEKLTSKMTEQMELTVPGFLESLSLVEFNPKHASESLWSAYFSISETIFREFNPKRRLPNRVAARQQFSTPNPLYTVKRWLLLDETGSAIASATISYDTELSPDYETSSHICHIQIEVAPTYRRKNIATRLLNQMIENASTMAKDTVRANAENPTGLGFCRYLKGELIHKVVQHRLYLEDVDWQLVDQWCDKGKARFPGTTVESFQECPEKDIDEFCKTYTEIINQRPVGAIQEGLVTTPESRRVEERNFKRRGTQWHTIISRERDGQISAMTDIMVNPREPHRIHQYFTGVLARYRRRGLAKRLKAEMLEYIKEMFPEAEYITTTTASDNKPMQAINKQLGFMPKKTYSMFQWTLQDLDRRVKKVLSAAEPVGYLKRKH